MVIYNVSVEERIAKLVSKSSQNSVNGNKGDEVHFTFDSEWEGQSEKVALFVWGGKYYPVEFTGNVCQVPPLYNTNNFRLGVYVGETTDSSAYLSSTEIEIPCKLSIRDFANSAHDEIGKNYTYEAKGYAESAKRDAEIAREFAENTEQIEGQIRRNDKRITNLEKGLPDDNFITDSTVAYVKDVPPNSLPYAEVKKIGGMTYKDGNTLKHAKVTEIESVGMNLFSPLIKGVGLNSSTGEETADGSSATTDYIQISLVHNGDYCISGMPTNLYSFVAFYDKNKNFVERTGAGVIFSTISLLEELTKANINQTNIAYIRITVYENSNVSGVISSVDNLQTMLNKGKIALPYSPYHCDILSIPKEVQVQNGVNDEVYDFIEWGKDGKSKRNIRVGKVDLGTLSWQFLAQASDGSQIYYSTSLGGFTHFSSNNSLCGEFSLMSHSSAEELKHGEYMTYGIGDSEVIALATKYYADAATFKAAMSGVMLYYELATPEVTDISDILTADNFIGVEGGGTITAVNEHGLAVPSEIEYQVEV